MDGLINAPFFNCFWVWHRISTTRLLLRRRLAWCGTSSSWLPVRSLSHLLWPSRCPRVPTTTWSASKVQQLTASAIWEVERETREGWCFGTWNLNGENMLHAYPPALNPATAHAELSWWRVRLECAVDQFNWNKKMISCSINVRYKETWLQWMHLLILQVFIVLLLRYMISIWRVMIENIQTRKNNEAWGYKRMGRLEWGNNVQMELIEKEKGKKERKRPPKQQI